MKFNKKPLLFFLCLASTFSILAGCDKKTKKNTTNNNTNVTTKANTTSKKTTRKATSSQTTTEAAGDTVNHEVNETIFNSYFKTDSISKIASLNYTLNVTDEGAINETRKIASNKALIEGFNSAYVEIGSNEDKVSLDLYTYDDDNDTWDSEGNIDYSVEVFVNEYCLPILDYSKFSYNSTSKKYTSTENVVFTDELMNTRFTYSNISISFDDNILKSISFDITPFDLDSQETSDSYSRVITISNEGSTSVVSPVDTNALYKVTKAEFDKYFNVSSFEELKGFNYTANKVTEGFEEGEPYTSNNTIEVDGSNIMIDSKYNDYLIEMKVIDSGKVNCDMYSKVTGSSQWVKYTPKIKIGYFLLEYMGLGLFDYSSFTYDSETKAYKLAQMTYEDDEEKVLSNIEIKFNDGVLQSIKYDYEDYGENQTDTFTFTKFDETEVINPMYAGHEDYMVNNETFDSYFNITAEEFDKLNLSINYTDTYTDDDENTIKYVGTVKFNGSIMNDHYTKNGKERFSSFIFTDIDVEDGDVWLDYCTYTEEDGWKDDTDSYSTVRSLLDSRLYLINISKSSLEFDVATDSYKASEIDMGDKVYHNVEIKFNKGKLVSLKYSTDTDVISLEVSEIEDATTLKYAGDYIVDGTTFNSYYAITDINALSALNYTASYSYSGEYSGSATIKANNGKFLVDSQTASGYESKYFYRTYESSDADKVAFNGYTFSVNYSEWVKNRDTIMEFYWDVFFRSELHMFAVSGLDFGDFTFNFDTMMYEADEIVVNENTTFTNVKIEFKNNKPSSFSYTSVGNSGTYNYQETFTNVGTTELVDPIGTDYEVGKSTFDKYFGINDYDKIADLNLTLEYSSGDGVHNPIEGTMEISNYNTMDTYTGIMGNHKDFHTIEKDEDKVIYYTYEYDSSTKWPTTPNYSDKFDVITLATEYLYLPVLDFSQLSYNATTKCYEGTNITVNGYTYSSISIKFEDGILKSYDISFTKGTATHVISATVSKVGSTEIDSPFKNIVNESDFNKYFGVTKDTLSSLNLTINHTGMIDNQYPNSGVIKIDSLKVLDISDSYSSYYEINTTGEHAVMDSYEYIEEDHRWYKGDQCTDFNKIMRNILLPVFDFSDFEYDSKTGCYIRKNFTIDGITYNNVSIKFEYGILKSYDLSYNSGNWDYSFSMTVTNVGTTTVTKPSMPYIED